MLIGLVGRPGKEAEAQVDSSRVQGIDGVAEVDSQILVSVKLAGPSDEHLGEVGVDSPIAHLVGIGQRAARNQAAEPHMIELCEDHAEKLIPTGEGLDAVIATVSRDALAELVHGKIVEQLSEDGPSAVHAMPSKLAEHGKTSDRDSNRFLPFWLAKASHSRHCGGAQET